MFDDDSERHECEIFGLRFTSTYAEQRRLWLRLSRSQESIRWGTLHHEMQLIVARERHPFVRELARELEDANRAMTELAAKLIEEMIASRSCG